ncbi:uncharacterized protein [Cicer arietinum]|uniref:Uncharacterized protein LOC101502407 n=1 Tax=Cicer arietinum TaxID=3827 RepID=A0A1S2XJD6_CICAR|nr:uncharacterized protein LOC101502407 [Cicer arietinum]
MEEQEKVSDLISRLRSITNQMTGCSEKLTEEKLCENILRSLRPKFNYIVCAIEESKDISILSLEELEGTLEVKEYRMEERCRMKPGDQALATQMYKKRDQSKHKKKYEDEAGATQEEAGATQEDDSDSNTILSKIRFADDRTLEAEGADNMVIKRRNGKIVVIENVLYVPGMKSSLLRIAQLIQKGFQMVVKDGSLEIYDGQKKMILKARLSKNITFVINIQATNIKCLKEVNSCDKD